MSYCGSCGYSNGCSSSASYSSIDSMVRYSPQYSIDDSVSYNMVEAAIPESPILTLTDILPNSMIYNKTKENYRQLYLNNQTTRMYYTQTNNFLDSSRPITPFIGKISKIAHYIKQAFKLTTGKAFPKDIIIRLVDDKEFNQPKQVIGFAINKKPFGVSSILIRKGHLDEIMVTIGHEIGHVLTKKLNNEKDEEAKAFAFSIAWLKTIKEHNIANLSKSINLQKPAQNGIHNIALNFVRKLINQGKTAFEIYSEIISGMRSCSAN